MTLQGMNRRRYETEPEPFSSGGEGNIYRIAGNDQYLIKVYHANVVSKELEEKIRIMAQRPPSAHILNQVAWPLDALYDSACRFAGFLMPKLDVTTELSSIYVYPPAKLTSNLAYHEKIIIAQNICTVINAIHEAGYIFGDFNPRNIGVNLNNGHVAFFDTDSYHIVLDEKSNRAYRCNVCLDGYVAPELLKKCEPYKKDAYAAAPLPTFTKETDEFALAIHIFKLLMNGFTPFNGIRRTASVSSASPGIGNQAVKRDSYCFKPGNKPQSAAVPDIAILPPAVRELFTRAFIAGRNDPAARPTAVEWFRALDGYLRSLKMCSADRRHSFWSELRTCPWCEADFRYKQQLERALHPQGPDTRSAVPSPAGGTAGAAAVQQAGPPVQTGSRTAAGTPAQGTKTRPPAISSAPQIQVSSLQSSYNLLKSMHTSGPGGSASDRKQRIAKIAGKARSIAVAALLVCAGIYFAFSSHLPVTLGDLLRAIKPVVNTESAVTLKTEKAEIVSVSATSWIVGKTDKEAFIPARAADGDENTSYQFSTKKTPLGDAYLVFEFAEPSSVNMILLKNGSWKKDGKNDHYTRNSRIKKMDIEYMGPDDAGYSAAKTVTLPDDGTGNGWTEIGLDQIDGVKRIRLRILDIYKGTAYPHDVCLSEIMFLYGSREGAAGT